MCVLERGCGVMYVYVCTSRHVCVSLCVWKVVEVVCIYIYICTCRNACVCACMVLANYIK